MATISTDTFQSSANLSLWFKVRAGDALNLADVPEIIPLRWTYFRDQWQTLRTRLSSRASAYTDPDYFRAALQDLDSFISRQRSDTTDTNPFSGNNVYYRFYPVFDSILVEQINLSNEEKSLLDKKKRTVKAFSKNDFLKIKQDITAYRDQLADSVGLGDDDYNRIYDRGNTTSNIEPTVTDLNLMMVLQNQLASINFILANLFAVDAVIDPFALAKLNANNPAIEIGQYNSGYLVRLQYGEDLQTLATRYLKDPNKWIDIAIANGLREPYIDEVGEELYLISNGSGTQLNVRADSSKFYTNQLVMVQSTTLPFPSQRLITAVKEIKGGEVVLSLSGDANLEQYLLADEASIRIFKPNTVNSSQFILIPTPIPLDNIRQDEIPWFQVSSAADEKKAKIDIAISDSGGLQFTSNGDIALSYGLANAIQATKLKLTTEKGANRYHPDFGIVNLVGTRNNSDADAKALLTTSISEQIQADPRFDRVESLSVARNVSTTSIAYDVNLVVRLAGSNTLIPISFTVTV